MKSNARLWVATLLTLLYCFSLRECNDNKGFVVSSNTTNPLFYFAQMMSNYIISFIA